MPRRDRRLLRALAASGVLLALLHGGTGLDIGLMYLAPALLLLLPLYAGRYVGERHLVRAVPSPARARRPTSAPPRTARRTRGMLPRGGALLAASLAGRPPPLTSPV